MVDCPRRQGVPMAIAGAEESPGLLAHGRLWTAYLIVFVSSACTLVLELVAGRLLAPYVGVSLYTWTSIIGVVLAGITGGAHAGGWLAGRGAGAWAPRAPPLP